MTINTQSEDDTHRLFCGSSAIKMSSVTMVMATFVGVLWPLMALTEAFLALNVYMYRMFTFRK